MLQQAVREDRATALVHVWLARKRAARAADRVMARFRTPPAQIPADVRSPRSASDRAAPRAVVPTRPPPSAVPPRPAQPPWRLVVPVALLAMVGIATCARRDVAPDHPGLAVAPRSGHFMISGGARSGDLSPGGEIHVRDGSVGLTEGKALRLTLRAGCTLRSVARASAAGTAGSMSLAQNAGVALYEVDPAAHLTLSVAIPGAEVRVIGTRFRIAVAGDRATVSVGEGTVSVSPDGAPPLRVSVGHELRLIAGRPDSEPAAFNVIADPDFADDVVPVGAAR